MQTPETYLGSEKGVGFLPTYPKAGTHSYDGVHGGKVTVSGQRLYRLIDFGSVRDRQISLELAPGVSAYAFTFG